MARIVELVLILNGLGGIATYFGVKAHRLKSGARKLVGGNDEHTPHFHPYEEKCEACNPPPEPSKRSFLAKVGDRIR
jgi:hypothetical protein